MGTAVVVRVEWSSDQGITEPASTMLLAESDDGHAFLPNHSRRAETPDYAVRQNKFPPRISRLLIQGLGSRVKFKVGTCLTLSCTSYNRIEPDGSQPLLFDGLQNTLHAVFSK